MDDLLGGLIGSAVSGELGATPIGVPTEISAILVSPEEIADAAAALFLRLQHVVKLENTAPPENATIEERIQAALKEERIRAALVFREMNRFIQMAWHDPGRVEVQRYLKILGSRILQLNDGVSHPIWSVSSTGKGKKPDAFELWDGRRWVCAAYKFYRDSGMPRHAAANRIAKHRENRVLRRLVHKATETKLRQPGKINDAKMAASIISWHEDFRDNNVPNFAQQMWAAIIEIVEGHQPTTPELFSFADASLNLARKTAAEVTLST